ncbi:MAG: translational GTPase TypA [Robiginitomaculum sp.]|nr:MAG: translational GTPase TypA [Robiginitomaculum sp.]
MPMRNIAIIAHVDHGKTTLVDQMLIQTGVFAAHENRPERAMDNIDQEQERGITIMAKCASVTWQGTRINIIDTPGHADFGGEVERILSMVDGAVLLIDAAEGPMPQTRFVLSKALGLGLKPMVVLNKVDRTGADPEKALNAVFDLFSDLGASDEQLDFPFVYAAGRDGWASKEEGVVGENLDPLFETIVDFTPAPEAAKRKGEPFTMLVTMLDADPYVGRVLTGRIESGTIRTGDMVQALARTGEPIERARLSKLFIMEGMSRVPAEEVHAGDVVAIAGFSTANVADTLAAPEVKEPITANPIDPPTMAVTISINDSPLGGRDGDKVQSRIIRDRLMREARSNVAIEVRDASTGADALELAGRGELQLGVLIETLRREGFELSVSRPRVLIRTDEATGERLEPYEEVVCDVDDAHSGTVIESLTQRKAELKNMGPAGAGHTRLVFDAPSRSLIGYGGRFLTETRGKGVLNRVFSHWGPWRGVIEDRARGALISMADGKASAFALMNIEPRGTLFIGAGEQVYNGMVIGECTRGDDLMVNPIKGKKLTNMRASGKDDAVTLITPRRLTLEQAIAWIADDEQVEVTPSVVRVRKVDLDPIKRKQKQKLNK